ncbi:hypothetical protein [Flavobacterium sp. N1994]|uniref:hypothetical protein n=1 Tax=Flavobacterium sp. N1994 TaxID=2986827 RepID=UPI002223A961|nr:hypothetical protein [Flavobacterium sp. N1994]
MARAISPKTLYEKVYKTFAFDGIWGDLLGEPEKGGFWVIYGNEKNGKTQLTLQLSDYLSKFETVWYVSAEEGTGKTFQSNVKRAKIDSKNKKLKFSDYVPVEEITERFKSRQYPKVIVLDNATIYNDELKNGVLRKLHLLIKDKDVTIILLAHIEDNGKEPYTATAKLAKKLCDIYIRVEGLTAFVGGRCPGGIITIDDQKAMLYHGSEITKQKK